MGAKNTRDIQKHKRNADLNPTLSKIIANIAWLLYSRLQLQVLGRERHDHELQEPRTPGLDWARLCLKK